jgi:dephospho-CoA kinase
LVVAGLTGGIATGKTTVAGFFAQAGAAIIDADHIARKVVKKGKPAWHEIIDYFGKDILLPDGELNRTCLADMIFSDHRHKEQLNRIVHPHVFHEIDCQLKRLKENAAVAVAVIDVPLLMETGLHRQISPVIVVYVPEKIQIDRLMIRDALSRAVALARMRAQMSIEEKKRWADFVIDNSQTKAHTRNQTWKVYRHLLAMGS